MRLMHAAKLLCYSSCCVSGTRAEIIRVLGLVIFPWNISSTLCESPIRSSRSFCWLSVVVSGEGESFSCFLVIVCAATRGRRGEALYCDRVCLGQKTMSPVRVYNCHKSYAIQHASSPQFMHINAVLRLIGYFL